MEDAGSLHNEGWTVLVLADADVLLERVRIVTVRFEPRLPDTSSHISQGAFFSLLRTYGRCSGREGSSAELPPAMPVRIAISLPSHALSWRLK